MRRDRIEHTLRRDRSGVEMAAANSMRALPYFTLSWIGVRSTGVRMSVINFEHDRLVRVLQP